MLQKKVLREGEKKNKKDMENKKKVKHNSTIMKIQEREATEQKSIKCEWKKKKDSEEGWGSKAEMSKRKEKI